MRAFAAVCFSLLLSAVPATASDQNLKEEIGKITSAYEQHFNKKDAAGITSLYTKNYLRVIPILKLIDRCRPNRGARLT